MVTDFFFYSIKSAAIFSLLYLPYYFLRNDTFFVRNRIYLISSVITALILPLLKFKLQQDNTPVSFILQSISVHENIIAPASQFQLVPLLAKIVITISSLFLLRFFVSLFRILFIILRNPREKRKMETIVWTKNSSDFSFFRFVFLSREKYNVHIHRHERVHVQRKHSVDIILFELYRCFQWFNPLAWMALKEIKVQHEYEADELTAGSDKNGYQALLLSSVLETDLVHMTNSFYCLTIKKRFNMMNKKRSPKKALAKTLIVFPFSLLSIGLVAQIHEQKIAPAQKVSAMATDDNTVMPEFKGGMQELMKYLSTNIKYPEKARKEKKEGKVFIKFVVDKSGKVKNASVAKGVSAEIDAEALRVVKTMPDWTPGTKNGKNADVDMTLPIAFKLD